ncbi:MAG TPA: YraN family protein [Tissierellales bacterium]|nr:YraN family protein [Tissierellales bacterium]
MRTNIEKGKLGEKIAEEYLVAQGYKILEKNFRIRTGEIDIIAIKNKILVFVEVKARTSTYYGHPYEAVNREKQMKIMRTALYYMSLKNMHYYQPRFDIVEVYIGHDKRINHIDNAFSM